MKLKKRQGKIFSLWKKIGKKTINVRKNGRNVEEKSDALTKRHRNYFLHRYSYQCYIYSRDKEDNPAEAKVLQV